jgi:D-alanyl-D-alanine carboxypeptidase
MHASSPLAATVFALGIALAAGAPSAHAAGEALLLIEADSGKVLKAENATYPWYPASVTKLMTAYVTLRAIKEGRISLDTVLTVSPNAVAQQPTKMGFKTGTLVTVDNALKMLMVKSANDMAVVLAEGVSGSVERFADEMNRASARLGMTQSSWVNPNGLPADDQITSARDMAILARAVLAEFPEYDGYWNIHAIRLGKRVIHNTNSLIVRYPGADGMKTGFICASGFNVVASATRENRRLIAVVLGAPSSAVRAAKAAHMFETAFNSTGLTWLMPSLGAVSGLQPINAAPPNLREAMCGKQRRRPAAEAADEEEEASGTGTGSDEPGSLASIFSNTKTTGPKPSALVAETVAMNPPIEVYIGPPRRPRDAAVAAAPAKQVDDKAPAARGKPAAAVGLLSLPGRSDSAKGVPTPRPRLGAQPASNKPKRVVPPAKPAVTAAKPLVQ